MKIRMLKTVVFPVEKMKVSGTILYSGSNYDAIRYSSGQVFAMCDNGEFIELSEYDYIEITE